MVRRGPTDEFEPALKAFFVRRRLAGAPVVLSTAVASAMWESRVLRLSQAARPSFLGGCTASSASSLRVLCWNQLGPSKVYRSQPEDL